MFEAIRRDRRDDPDVSIRELALRHGVHRAYATCSQEAFLDGHRYAFEQLGGIPTVHIRYDNLKAAVSRVLTGRTRVESDRWVLFRSHYGFDVFYCDPVSKAPTRRAVWRAREAGSAAPTPSPCPQSSPSPS